MIKVLKGFYDIKEGVFRSVGQDLKSQKSVSMKSTKRYLALLNGKTNNQK